MKKNIILIGFMGVGKGTIARELAKQSGYYAVDTDDLIQSLTNKKIKTIFKESGEKHFRGLEQKTANWIQNNLTKTIVSVGGGFYKVDNLKKLGTVIYLNSPFDDIYNRIITSPNAKNKLKKRPLFQKLNNAKELYNKRVKEYEKLCDIKIEVNNKTEKSIVNNILKKIKNNGL